MNNEDKNLFKESELKELVSHLTGAITNCTKAIKYDAESESVTCDNVYDKVEVAKNARDAIHLYKDLDAIYKSGFLNSNFILKKNLNRYNNSCLLYDYYLTHNTALQGILSCVPNLVYSVSGKDTTNQSLTIGTYTLYCVPSLNSSSDRVRVMRMNIELPKYVKELFTLLWIVSFANYIESNKLSIDNVVDFIKNSDLLFLPDFVCYLINTYYGANNNLSRQRRETLFKIAIASYVREILITDAVIEELAPDLHTWLLDRKISDLNTISPNFDYILYKGSYYSECVFRNVSDINTRVVKNYLGNVCEYEFLNETNSNSNYDFNIGTSLNIKNIFNIVSSTSQLVHYSETKDCKLIDVANILITCTNLTKGFISDFNDTPLNVLYSHFHDRVSSTLKVIPDKNSFCNSLGSIRYFYHKLFPHVLDTNKIVEIPYIGINYFFNIPSKEKVDVIKEYVKAAYNSDFIKDIHPTEDADEKKKVTTENVELYYDAKDICFKRELDTSSQDPQYIYYEYIGGDMWEECSRSHYDDGIQLFLNNVVNSKTKHNKNKLEAICSIKGNCRDYYTKILGDVLTDALIYNDKEEIKVSVDFSTLINDFNNAYAINNNNGVDDVITNLRQDFSTSNVENVALSFTIDINNNIGIRELHDMTDNRVVINNNTTTTEGVIDAPGFRIE